MLTSIHPLGERARNQRFGITAAAYVVGSALGGLALGVAAGGVGDLAMGSGGPDAGVAFAAAALVLFTALLEARGRSPLPGPRRQVDEDWLTRYRGWVYGLGFGVQLGTGVVTIVTTAAVYLTVVLAALTGSLVHGATIGLAFGVIRALPVLAVARVETPGQLRAVQRRVVETGDTVRRISAATLLVLALLLGGAGLAAA